MSLELVKQMHVSLGRVNTEVDTDQDCTTVAVGYLDTGVTPGPPTVRDFLETAKSGEHPGPMHPPRFREPNEFDDLEWRLAEFV